MWQHSASHIPEMFTLLSLKLFLGHALGKTWGKCQKYITLTVLLCSPGKPYHYCAPSTPAQTPQSQVKVEENRGEQEKEREGWGTKRVLSLKISPDKVVVINCPITLCNLRPTLIILDEQMRTSLFRATASTLPNPTSSTNNPRTTESHLSTVPS